MRHAFLSGPWKKATRQANGIRWASRHNLPLYRQPKRHQEDGQRTPENTYRQKSTLTHPANRPSSGSTDDISEKAEESHINQIVPGGKQHQGHNHHQTDTKSVFLSPFVKRLPTYSFRREIQEMPPSSGGMGNRLMRPRLMDSTARNQKVVVQPYWAISPRHLGDTQGTA